MNLPPIVDVYAAAGSFGSSSEAIGPLGALNPTAFVTGAASDASDRIICNNLTGQLLHDADGNGAGATVQFAILSTGLTFTASDFRVI